jgi:hypothetical protein
MRGREGEEHRGGEGGEGGASCIDEAADVCERRVGWVGVDLGGAGRLRKGAEPEGQEAQAAVQGLREGRLPGHGQHEVLHVTRIG